ncbi:MAG TPA: glutathione transferase GstA [Polyangiaceae bacterium]|nr:glutathione transferase GstA [Polyangiaceae bacterium]
MKLYFAPGACSLHPHIALIEAGQSFDLVRVDTRAHKTQDGTDYYTINPKGSVPALELDDGSVLTEGAVIDQYIADRKPEAKLAPPAGTMDRYRLQEWLNFIASEIHKSFTPLFGSASDDVKQQARARIGTRFDLVARALETRPYLVGSSFTVADAYLYNMLRWTHFTGIELTKWPALKAFFGRVDERPSVKKALEAEASKR